MGDPVNIFVVNRSWNRNGEPVENGLYLYSHWGGATIVHAVQKALALRLRWDDEGYLAVIVFDEVRREQSVPYQPGLDFALTTAVQDNLYPIIVMDCQAQEVGYARQGDEPQCFVHWTFTDFVTTLLADLESPFYTAGFRGRDSVR